MSTELQLSASDTEALLRRIRDDDVAALDAVLRLYWPAVLGYLTRFLGSADAAEDVAQRTFLRLWERRADWHAEGSLRALLFSIARNLAITEQRNAGARWRAQGRFFRLTPELASPEPDPVERQELAQVLDAAIQALPSRRREIFVLRCLHDLSYAEIATILEISPQTVANQLSRALSTLRRELAWVLEPE